MYKAILMMLFLLPGVLLASPAEPDIGNIVACNVYWHDYQYTRLNAPEAAKFVITFATNQRVDVALIDSISVNGPEGYSHTFQIQPFSLHNLSGYVDEVANNVTWFQTYDAHGFLANGTYTIALKYKSGKTSIRSRTLNYSAELLTHNKQAQPTFVPYGQLARRQINSITLEWDLIPKIDAYYSARLMQHDPTDPASAIVPIMFDNIFAVDSAINNGLNRYQAVVPNHLDPHTMYVWFTEILDSNRLDQINIAIFQPAQFFWFSDR